MDDWIFVTEPTADINRWIPSELTDDDDGTQSQPLKLVFTEPAKHWTDAAPIGNGRLGAMVWGGVPSETLQLNDDTLWTGIPGNYTNPDSPQAVAKVREFVDKGKYAEATEEAFKLLGNPAEVYQPLGDIRLEFDDTHAGYDVKTYERELDLNTATVKVKYSVGDVVFTREHFVSNPDQAVVTKISSSKSGSLSFTVFLDSKLRHHSLVNADNQIIMEGSCPGKRVPPKVDSNDNPKGIQFTAVLGVQISSEVGVLQVLDDEKLKVEGSDWAILMLVSSSSFDGPFTKPVDSKKDPTAESLTVLNSIKYMPYSDLYAHHLVDYQKLFQRVSLQLSKSSKNAKGHNGMKRQSFSSVDGYTVQIESDLVSTAERVKSFQTDEDPSLVELLFQYGRYLLISSSRPGSQPSNLQGIWNQDLQPAFDCAPHLNINLQMNYWPSLSGNLSECQEPLFDYISVLSINERRTSQVNYECGGWVTHQISDIWAKTSPDRGDPVWAVWPMGGAWLCTHLWEHFMYTMDKILGRNEDIFVQKVQKAQSQLYPTKIARDGSILEWAEDFGDPQVTHRHLSHLFGLFPGHTITVEKNPDLCKAAANTLYKRGVDGPGWSTTLKASLWARLHDNQHSYQMLKHLITLVDPDDGVKFERGLYSNLFNAHPPFQIDANFGFTAAVAEMLVQSTMKDLYLLPALPRDKWASGCVKGLKARGGLTVSICWREGQLHQFGVWCKDENSLKIFHYDGRVVTTRVDSGYVYTFDNRLKCVKKQPLVF
ncbi:alpha-L-fucosidase [Ranunculus cassubicifolius]